MTVIREALWPTALLLLIAVTTPADAHYPFCICQKQGEAIRCRGGFSDGAGAVGVTLDVIEYDETLLVHATLDQASTVTFKAPSSGFYVLFDAGPGHVVEVDQMDIR